MWQSSDVGKTVVAKSLTYSQPILQDFKYLVGFRFETFLQVADLSGNIHRCLPFHTLPDLFFMGWIDITKFKCDCWAMEELWAESHFWVEDARKSISVGLTGLRRAVKLLQANWVISLQFFSCAADCRELYFLADCQFILAWLKSSPIECAGRRRGNCRQCNDWVVKWSQCVEAAPGKEIGSCLRNETFPPRGKESNVNSVIKSL